MQYTVLTFTLPRLFLHTQSFFIICSPCKANDRSTTTPKTTPGSFRRCVCATGVCSVKRDCLVGVWSGSGAPLEGFSFFFFLFFLHEIKGKQINQRLMQELTPTALRLESQEKGDPAGVRL